MKNSLKIISNIDIQRLNIDPLQCLEWVTTMLKNKDQVILPAKISMKPTDEIFYNVMPSLLPQYETGGVKIVTRYPTKNPTLDSQVLLYDYKTGALKALIDGNYITTMRTGAVAAHSISLFGKKDFSIIGIIGLGNQARATLKVLFSLFPKKEFVLKLFKYKDQHIAFQDYIKNSPFSENINFVFCDTYKETISESDVIISSATYLAKDLCDNNCYDEGCLVIPIHTRGFMNCDLFFDKIFADDTEHVRGFKYFNQFKNFSEVSSVLNGSITGRQSDKERIIVYNIGLSMHDIYFAEQIYQQAIRLNIGESTSLTPPKDKFWI